MAQVEICIYPSGYTLTAGELAKFGATHRYTDMSSMEAGEDIDWVSATDNPYITILAGDGSNNWSTAGLDTSAVIISGWTLSSTYPFMLTAEGTARSEGAWDTDAYTLAVGGNIALDVSSSTFYGQIEGIQIDGTGSSSEIIVRPRSFDTFDLKNCWIQNSSSVKGSSVYQYILSPPHTFRMWNCVLDGAPAQCIVNRFANSYVYHNTMTTASNYCLRAYAGTNQYVDNNALFNNNDDWNDSGFASQDYNASDDAEGTNAVDISPGATEADEWDKAFADYSNGDYAVKDTDSVLYNAGKDLSSQFTDTQGDTDPLKYDKLGNDRSATWDIGAFVFVAAGGVNIAPLLYYNRMLRQ